MVGNLANCTQFIVILPSVKNEPVKMTSLIESYHLISLLCFEFKETINTCYNMWLV